MARRCAILNENGVVVNLIVGNPEDIDPGKDLSLRASDTASVGDIWYGTSFVRPAPAPPSLDELKAYAAAIRWRWETGRITLDNGAVISCSAEVQSKIAAAKAAFDTGALKGAIDFKAGNGWLSVGAAEMTAIHAAVVAHVEACYRVERSVSEKIAAGAITTLGEIEEAFARFPPA